VIGVRAGRCRAGATGARGRQRVPGPEYPAPMTDPHDAALRPRSRAWLLGWLSLIGPAGVVASIVLVQLLREVQFYVGVILFAVVSVVTFAFGIAGVRRGIRDARRHHAERPRLIGGGIAVASVGLLASGAVVLVIGGILFALSQYRP
jgi:hypothetical protein